jgi:GNAT superfamily N-acetyltransferase
MDFIIKGFGEVTEETMLEIVRIIDRQCFSDEHHDLDYELMLHRINKRTLCALYQNEELAGYIEMLPLTELARDELTQGIYNIEELKPEHIAEYKQELSRVTLYVRSLAVLPEYNKTSVSVRLISEAAAFALKLGDEGINVDEIVTYFTNKRLEKILERKGFKQKYVSRDGLPIYSLPAEKIHLFV